MKHRERSKLNWWKPRSSQPFPGFKSQGLRLTAFRSQSKCARTSKLLFLLDNSLVQFLIGLFLIALVTQGVNSLENLYLKLVLSTLSYGIFFYLSTPFTIYWLAYLSSVRLTQVKLGITVLLVSIYSYLLWDCYFLYRDILSELLFSFSPI